MNKYTPGSWIAVYAGDQGINRLCQHDIFARGDQPIAVVYGEKTDPNARLIASAPELLEALEKIADESAATWVTDVARAAIAKATGGAA